MHARLLVLAAAAQVAVAVAYLDSLWLVKSTEAEREKIQQLEEGFADAQLKSPFAYLTTMDKFLSCVVVAAPIMLMVASRYSTVRSACVFVCVSDCGAATDCGGCATGALGA